MSSSLTKLPEISFVLQVKILFDPKDRTTSLQAFKPCYEAVLSSPERAYFLFGENVQESGVFRWLKKDVGWFIGIS
jgi:hypothetical protein